MDINEIIMELKNHNHSNFDYFYKLTNRHVFFASYSILKDHHLAEDILQETYMVFLTKIDEYRIGYNVYVYLTTIARNLSINHFNKHKRINHNDELLLNVRNDVIKSSYDLDRIMNLLDDNIEKEVITYHVILEYKFLEISKIIQKPLGTILWIYNKAIKKLKERIGEIL